MDLKEDEPVVVFAHVLQKFRVVRAVVFDALGEVVVLPRKAGADVPQLHRGNEHEQRRGEALAAAAHFAAERRRDEEQEIIRAVEDAAAGAEQARDRGRGGGQRIREHEQAAPVDLIAHGVRGEAGHHEAQPDVAAGKPPQRGQEAPTQADDACQREQRQREQHAEAEIVESVVLRQHERTDLKHTRPQDVAVALRVDDLIQVHREDAVAVARGGRLRVEQPHHPAARQRDGRIRQPVSRQTPHAAGAADGLEQGGRHDTEHDGIKVREHRNGAAREQRVFPPLPAAEAAAAADVQIVRQQHDEVDHQRAVAERALRQNRRRHEQHADGRNGQAAVGEQARKQRGGHALKRVAQERPPAVELERLGQKRRQHLEQQPHRGDGP